MSRISATANAVKKRPLPLLPISDTMIAVIAREAGATVDEVRAVLRALEAR